MANDSNGEKTEKPTPKRKKDARREGQIARTNDLPAWLSILAFTYLVPHTLRAGMEQGQRMFTGMGDVLAGDEGAMLGFLGDALFRGTLVLAPLVLMAMVLGVLGQVEALFLVLVADAQSYHFVDDPEHCDRGDQGVDDGHTTTDELGLELASHSRVSSAGVAAAAEGEVDHIGVVVCSPANSGDNVRK